MPDSLTVDSAISEIDPQVFRGVLGHFLTGVAVVSAMDEAKPVGLAIGSFFSISLDPPLVGFCAANSSSTWPAIKQSGRFCVNILAADQEAICGNFARSGTDKFAGVSWSASGGGSPLIEDVIAWIDCDIDAVHSAGDHEICIGRVRALGAGRPADPLPFFRGRHRID